MTSESDLKIIENDPFENSDNSDDIDYEPNYKKSKRTRKATKRFGNRTSTKSHDDFFKNYAAQKSITHEIASKSPNSSNEQDIPEKVSTQLTKSNDKQNVSKENIEQSLESIVFESVSKEKIDQSELYTQLEDSIMTKLSSFESNFIETINSKFESYYNAIKVLQTQVARIETKLNQRRSSISSFEESNNDQLYINELELSGFPLDSNEKVDQLETNLIIEKYHQKLVRLYNRNVVRPKNFDILQHINKFKFVCSLVVS